MNPFQVRSSRDDTHALLAVSGEFDIATAPEVDAALTAAEDAGANLIVVDLSDAEFLDSTALSVLIRSSRRVGGNGGRFEVVCPPDHIELIRVFEVIGADQVLVIHPTLDATGWTGEVPA